MQWTKVEDGLPKKHVACLVACEGGVSVGKFWPHERGVHDDDDDWEVFGYEDWKDPAVTHWMPLPDPPETHND